MLNSFSSLNISSGLGRKFFLWFLVMALIPLLVVGAVSYHYARESLLQNIEQSLTASTQLKKKYIVAFFAERLGDMELQAALAENVQFAANLHQLAVTSGDRSRKKPLQTDSKRIRNDLVRFIEQYGYHDVLLIDLDGSILFAVHENQDYVGENVFTGHFGKTLFAEACGRALVSKQTEFADIESHGDGHELDSFLTRAMLGEDGEPVALIALEMSLLQVNQLVQDRAGMGETGETFLVGNDQIMRSDSWRDQDKDAMEVRVATDPVRDWLASEEVAADGTKAHKVSFAEVRNYLNHRGEQVFGVISNLETLEPFGVHWALVAEITEDEAMALTRKLRSIIVSLIMVTTLLVALISALVAKGIVAPIRMLSAWSGRVAEGDLAPISGILPKNELGNLYDSFSRMVHSIQDVTDVCRAVALGDFGKSVTVRGEHDTLGKAVNQMGENLRSAVRQADVVAEGDFSVQITPWSEHDALGKALLRMVSKLREMDEAIRRSLTEARLLANYLDQLPMPVLFIDCTFKINYVNKAGAAFAGLSQSSGQGRQCYDLFGNGHCRTSECRVARAMRNKQVETAETIIDIKGQMVPVRYTGAPVMDEKGEVIGALEYIVDISEIKEAFTVIEKENWVQAGIATVNDRLRGDQRLSDFCNNLLSGLAQTISAEVAAIYVHENSVLQLYGLYATTGNNRSRSQFAVGEGLVGQAAAEKRTMLVSDIPEECMRMVAGTVEAAPRQLVVVPLIHENEVKGVLELGSFAALSDDAMLFLERVAGNIAIALNSQQSRLQLAELLKETQMQAEELQSQQEELRVTNEELEAQTQSLKEREVELQAQHEELMTLNEELEEKTDSLEEQKAGVQQKNSALKVAQEELEKKADDLAIASKYKSEFMANMSHELRTPLNSLLLLSHNLAQNRDGNLSADQVESAQVMNSSGKDLLELINEILDLSKIEAGRIELGVSEVHLVDFADRLQQNFAAVAREKGLGFVIDIAADAPKVINTDRQRLEQIIRNLIANAIKFTAQGTVNVAMRSLNNEDRAAAPTLAVGEGVAIAVTDTGIGIPVEKQKIVFEAFQQADGSTSRNYGGTGLGLSISRELAGLLGGEIGLTSSPEQGATFSLYLPLTAPLPEEESATVSKPTLPCQVVPSIPKPTPRFPEVKISDDRQDVCEEDKIILIIEDDPNFVKCLIQQSHEKGFKGLAALNGHEGLMLAEEYRPGAIILDLNLPDMTGWEVLEALKKNPLLRHIPVHMMSAEEKTLDAYRKGAVGYLRKPVNQDDLFAAFDRLEGFIDKDLRELLVVEDDAVLRGEIVKLIGNGDVHTTAVATGEEVIAILLQQRFDCMILDIGLPDMSGFELFDRLEKESKIHIPPVIVYTGRELTREEHDRLYQYTDSIIIKGVKSVERLLDETALFLHRVVAKMPDEKRKMIANLYEQDAMFADKKVLVVDDDMRNAFALSRILSEKQMEVLVANNGFRALELIAEADVDLVLMDIMMPEMDGYEAMRRIRAQEKYWNLPIIALTAKAMPEDKGKCMAAGASDYLTKPIEEGRLLSMMRIWLYQ